MEQDTSPAAPCNATALYVSDADPHRTRTYPFREGQQIPHTIDVEGATFSLRVVTYESTGLEITRVAA